MVRTPPGSILERSVYNFFFTGLGSLSLFVIGFLFAGLLIRFLGIQRAGYFLVIQSLIGLNALMGNFGLNIPLVQKVASLHSEGDIKRSYNIIGSVNTIISITALVISTLILLFFPVIFKWTKIDDIYRSDAFGATFFLLGSFLFTQVSNSWQATYEALQRYDLVTLLSTSFELFSGILRLILLYFFPSMTAVAIAIFVVTLIRFLSDIFFIRRFFGDLPFFAWSWKEFRPLLGFSSWSYLERAGSTLFNCIDRLVFTTLLGSTALVYYAVPQRFYLQIHGALAEQYRFLFPLFSSCGDKATDKIQETEDRFRWFVLLVSGLVYTGLALIGPVILSKIVDPEFATKVKLPLRIACIQGFFHAHIIVPYYCSLAVGHAQPNAVLYLVNGLVVLFTMILLIPKFGFLGASIAQLWIIPIAIIHILWVRHIVLPRVRVWGWLPALFSPFIMIVVWLSVSGIFRYFIPDNPIIFLGTVLLGGIIGVAVVWLIEEKVFQKYRRWSTLAQTLKIITSRIQNRIDVFI